jgi:hypothetical protein
MADYSRQKPTKSSIFPVTSIQLVKPANSAKIRMVDYGGFALITCTTWIPPTEKRPGRKSWNSAMAGSMPQKPFTVASTAVSFGLVTEENSWSMIR